MARFRSIKDALNPVGTNRIFLNLGDSIAFKPCYYYKVV